MTETDERLGRIEDRIAHIEQILANVERTILPVLANPGKLLAKMIGARGELCALLP